MQRKWPLVICVAVLLLFLSAAPAFAVDSWDGTAVAWTKGTGTETDPYLIETAEHLAYLAKKVNEQTYNTPDGYSGKHFKLMADLDLSGHQWIPIGYELMQYNGIDPETSVNPFRGIFDGNDHRVSGLNDVLQSVKMGSNNDPISIGVFGLVSNGSIKNLTVTNSTLNTTTPIAGVICGALYKGSITNCYVDATVRLTNTHGNSGAICGYVDYSNPASSITGCVNAASITDTRLAGGIGGDITSAVVSECVNTGDISGAFWVGGIGGSISRATIEKCYNTGSVTGTQYVGGIVGDMSYSAQINNTYNTGSVTRSSTGSDNLTGTGGIVGRLGHEGDNEKDSSYIKNCHNYGAVSSDVYVGGVIGRANYYTNTVSNCYYLEGTAVSGTQNGVGAVRDQITADITGITEKQSQQEFGNGTVTAKLQNANTPNAVWSQTQNGKAYPYPILVGVNNAVGQPTTFTISVENGTADITEAAAGETVTITAVVPEGYTFASWTVQSGGVALSNRNSANTTFTMGSQAVSVKANLSPISYTITYALNHGTLDADKLNPTSYTVESEPITLNNPTLENYTFAGWEGTGLDKAKVNVTIPTGSIGDRRYTATWTKNQHAIAAVSEPELGGTVIGAGTYAYGATATLTATANAGHAFVGWYDGETKVGDDTSYSFTVTEARSLTAKFTHVHSWSYQAQDNTITASCTATGCSEPNGGSVKVAAPEGQLKYNDSNVKTASVTGTFTTGISIPTDIIYSYKASESEEYAALGATPENAGWYKASISVTPDGGSAVTAFVEYQIAKAATPAAPSSLTSTPPTTYGGSDGKISGVDSTMEYATNADFTNAADCTADSITGLKAGTYYIRVKETANVNAGTAAVITIADGVNVIPVPTANTGLVYTSSEQSGVPEGTGYTLAGHKATNAGKYTATATLVTGYQWSDDTTEAKTIEWSIAKAQPTYAAPTAKTGLVHDGSQQELVTGGTCEGGTLYYRLGTDGTWSDVIPVAADKGSYAVYYYAKGDSNHEDAGSEAAPFGPITCEIGAKPLYATVTINGWTYGETASTPSVTGKEGNGAVTYTYYTDAGCSMKTSAAHGASADGGQPANAGSYWVKASIAAEGNYAAAETQAVSFTIAKATQAAPTVTGSYTANEGKTAFVYTITSPAGENYKYSKDGVNWQTSSVFDGFTAGQTATFYARLKEDANHEAGEPGNTGVVTFKKLDRTDKPSLDYTVTGNSGDRTITISVVEGAEYRFGSGDWGSQNAQEHIDDQVVTVSIRYAETDLFNPSQAASADVNTIKSLQTITMDTSALIITYGETPAVRTATASGTITYESSDPTVATVDVNSGAVTVLKAGTVTITAKAAETADYASVQASYTLIVNPKEITETMISLDQASYVYDSTEKKPAVTVTDGSQVLTETVDYTIGGDTIGTDVNTYTITITGMGNYTGTPSVQWSITMQPAQAAPTGLNSAAASAAGASDGKITGVNSTMEWSMDSSFATPNPIAAGQTEITGLAAGTYYVRYKATSNTEASNYATVMVADGPSALQGMATISGQPKFGEQLTVQVTGSNNSGTLSYQWKRGEDEIAGAQQPTYTLKQDDIGKVITCVVTSSVETGSLSSSTVAIEKADGPAAPTGLTTTAPTTYGGGDGIIAGVDSTMEYAGSPDFADAQDCTGSAITGLEAGTYYVRVKETETTKAGLAAQISVSDGMSTLPVPTAKTGLKYTGSEQTGVAEGAGYTLTGHTATNAGSYTATATLAIDYKWSDGTTEDKRIAWEIGKADAPAAPTGLTTTDPTTYGGNDGAISGMNSTMEWSSDGVSYQPCNDSSITGLKAGTYYVRFKETENEKAGLPATLVINEPVGNAPVISTASLPNGMVGTVYSQQLQANGTAPIEWILADGSSLPAGLTLSEEGLISGTPATAGTTSFTVQAKNAIGEAEIALTMTVDPVPLVPQAITVDVTPSRTIIQGKASITTLTIGKGLPDLSANSFASLTVDGQRIQRGSETFEVYTGSVIIQLHPAYLNTLPVGEHHVVIELQGGVYDGRSAKTSIIVAPAEDANASSTPPKTGDSSHPVAWSMTMLIALFGVVSLIGKRKRA